jgi:hypothetical protein
VPADRDASTADERIFLDENPDLLDALQALRAARPLEGPVDSPAPGRGRLSQQTGGARRRLGWTSIWSRL